MLRLLGFASVLFALSAAAAVAQGLQETFPPPSPSPSPAADSLASPAELAVPDAPVPVPDPSEKALRYHRSGNLLWLFSTLWGLAVPLALLMSGLSARLRDGARRLSGGRWFPTVFLYALFFVALTWLIDLPLSYYSSFVRPHEYGLSNQTGEKWLSDALKGLGVGMVSLALFLWVPYLLIRKSPRRWWLYMGLAAIPLMALVLLVTPIWVQPLFNRFGPMQNEALEARILALADRAGIEGSRVFEVNKSVDTKQVNAYVTGFGHTKRIVLWDTLLQKLDTNETLFVMGHEMGHYVLRHTWWLIGIASSLTLLSLFAVHRFSGSLIARFHHRFRFRELSDVASLPLLLFIMGLVSLALAPLVNLTTRTFEHEADRFGLELTRLNRPAAEAFVKLQEENLVIPYPGLLYKLWRSSHPSLGERIEFANTYRPWETGKRLRYQDRMKPRTTSPSVAP